MDLTALRADVVSLQKDMDELKSTNISMLWGYIGSPENMPFEIPPATMTVHA